MRIKLSERLNAAAALVKGGGVIADIGTDHAYLPCFLIQNSISQFAIASDIAEGPLLNAKATVIKAGLLNNITLRLSDGLCAFEPGEANEFVFAGMGGTLIAEKLRETPWIYDESLHFVFQPQSRAEDLRLFLFENGFAVEKELSVHEGERFYIAFSARYTGAKCDFKPSELYIGKLPSTADSFSYLCRQASRLQKKYDALLISSPDSEATAELKGILSDIKDFIND